MNFQGLDHFEPEMKSQFESGEDIDEKQKVRIKGDQLTTLNETGSNVQEPSLQPVLTQDQSEIEKELWNKDMNLEFAKLYLEHLCLQKPIKIMQEKYTELINWTPSDFLKQYRKILRKAFAMIQLEFQMVLKDCLPIICMFS